MPAFLFLSEVFAVLDRHGAHPANRPKKAEESR